MNYKTLKSYLILLDKNIERYLLIVTYFYITFVIIIGVFNRFILRATSGWETETATLLFIWLTWIGASLAVRRRSHIRIDFLYNYVSEQQKGILYVISDVSIIAFCIIAFQAFIPVIQNTQEFGSSLVSLPLSVIFFQFAIPVGLGLMCIRALQLLVLDIQSIRKNEEVYEGAALFEIYEETGQKDEETGQKEVLNEDEI